jgi:hypothetical protein
MRCPQCGKKIPAKHFLLLRGADGSVCPHCAAGLCPRASCAVALFLLACAAGDVTLILLRRAGAESWLAFAGFFVVFAAAYLAGMRFILRMRVTGAAAPIGQRGAEAHRHSG